MKKKKLDVSRGSVGKRFPASPSLVVIIESLILTFVLEVLSRQSLSSAAGFLFGRPHVFLFNATMVAVTLAFAMLFRKKLLSLVLVTVFWLTIGISNTIVLTFRNATPLTAVDLQLGIEALHMVSIYFKMWQIILVIAIVVAVVSVLVLLAVRSPKYRKEGQTGIVRFLSFSIVCLITAIVLFSNPSIISRELRPSLYDSYLKYGFPYCFSYSFFDIGIAKPEGYRDEDVVKIVRDIDIVPVATEPEAEFLNGGYQEDMVESDRTGSFNNDLESYTVEAVEAIRERMERDEVSEDQILPNIIIVQLESFFDPTFVKGLTFSEDPIPNFRKLKENNTSGILYVPTVGGGTANTEFEVLTGCSIDYFGAGEFPFYSILKEKTCESLAIDLRALDYHATAIHNYTGSFYYRNTVYDNLGFNTFVSKEYMNGFSYTPRGWPTDDVLQGEIRDALDTSEGKDFVFCVTVQTHGKYIEMPAELETPITVEGYEDESDKLIMEYYLMLLQGTDQLIGRMIEEYSAFDEDVMIIFYGDHLPSLSFTNEDLTTGDIYASEYVIWTNYGLERQDADLEAYQLGAYALGLNNIDTGTMIRFHQTQMGRENYLTNLEILEYDMLYGKKHVYEGRELKETGELMMGIHPVVITDVRVKNEHLFVYGENFTFASTVFLDDEKCDETVFIDEHLVVVPRTQPKNGTLLKVVQLTDDNNALSETEEIVCEGLAPVDYSK